MNALMHNHNNQVRKYIMENKYIPVCDTKGKVTGTPKKNKFFNLSAANEFLYEIHPQ
jgi:hypothetical protein